MMPGSAVSADWTFGWILVAMSAIVTSVNLSLQPLQYFANCALKLRPPRPSVIPRSNVSRPRTETIQKHTGWSRPPAIDWH